MDKIRAVARDRAISDNALAKATGIPLTTLKRKLDGYSEFTVGEIARLAVALGVAGVELLPPELTVGASSPVTPEEATK